MKWTILFITLALSSNVLSAQQGGFQAGEEVIFQDSIHGEELYEFPSRWKFINGTVEIDENERGQFVDFRARKNKIEPRFDNVDYLPDWFTVEFDVFCPAYGNTTLYVRFNQRQQYVKISKFGATYDGTGDGRDRVQKYLEASHKGDDWKRVEISFHKRALKVYMDGEKMMNIPQIESRPTNIQFEAFSTGVSESSIKTIKLDNIRIAKGGIPLYDRLIEEGKLVFNNILFDYNRHSLQESSHAVLDKIAKLLTENPDLKLSIEGHTDSDGTDEFNLGLSQKRANTVQTYLLKKGAKHGNLTTIGKGESTPINNETTDEAKAQNRRVEFVLINN